MTRPFRFGLLLQTPVPSRVALRELTRRAADAGFDIVLATDHFGQHGALQVLQTVAELSGLRIGTLVLNNDMRHPVVLAHELAALDVTSDGRLEIGLGAGWSKWEYDHASMPFDRPGQRVSRLEATVAVLKQALAEGRIDHDSGTEAYGVIRLDDVPRSLQRPHPPILIGGGGRRLLSLAAREAQAVAVDPRALPEGGHRPEDSTVAIVEEKVAWVRAAAGERMAELDINTVVFDFDPGFRPAHGRPNLDAPHLQDAEIEASPYYLLGDVEAMVDTLFQRREQFSINYLAIKENHIRLAAPLVARLAGK